MSDVFEEYEGQYKDISGNLSKKCVFTRLLDGEQRKQKIAEIKAGLKDAEALICKMDLEARSLQQNVKVMPLAKLREYKSDLNNLKIEVKRMTSANFNQAARNDFLEAGLAGKKMAVAAQRGNLVAPAAKLKQSSERIKESRRTMLDTEVRAVSVLQDLRRQRQSLLNTQEVLHAVDDDVDRGKKILTAISRLL